MDANMSIEHDDNVDIKDVIKSLETIIDNNLNTDEKCKNALSDALEDRIRHLINKTMGGESQTIVGIPAKVKAEEMWCDIDQFNIKCLKDVNQMHSDQVRDAKRDVFRQWYVGESAERLGGELDKIRKDPNFTGTAADMSHLIRILQQGAREAIFDDTCVDGVNSLSKN